MFTFVLFIISIAMFVGCFNQWLSLSKRKFQKKVVRKRGTLKKLWLWSFVFHIVSWILIAIK